MAEWELGMRTHKLKLILIAASILALGAGVFAGMAVSRMPAASAGTPSSAVAGMPVAHASIADELQLTDSQRDQMRSIWEGVRTDVHQTSDQAQVVQKDRDQAIFALLNDSQKAQYAALTQQAAERIAALNNQRDQAFHHGVEQTRKILSDSQRQTYDRIINDRVGTDRANIGQEGANSAGGAVSTGSIQATQPILH
jgi:Spy/CpxP family protein refolding chaperone